MTEGGGRLERKANLMIGESPCTVVTIVASEMDPGVDHNEATGVAEVEGA